LDEVHKVVQMTPDPKSSPRRFLRQILEGPYPENDLEPFKNDEAFRKEIYGDGDQAAEDTELSPNADASGVGGGS
jgi:hypothetical protein